MSCLFQDLRVLSLLFSASPPQKADVSEMLLPSLKKLLSVCRKHQKLKQEKLKEQQQESEKKEDDTEEEMDEQGNVDEAPKADDDGRAPPNKRRRGDEEAAASVGGETSQEKTSDEKTEKAEQGESSKITGHRKTGSKPLAMPASGAFAQRFPSDWVDTLAKIIDPIITKVPK